MEQTAWYLVTVVVANMKEGGVWALNLSLGDLTFDWLETIADKNEEGMQVSTEKKWKSD